MKKRKTWKRILIGMLTGILAVGMVGCSGEKKKEGSGRKLKIAVQMYNDSGDPEGQWFYKYIEKEMGIDLEIEKFTSSNTSEYLSLLLADGDLPDIIIGGGFGTSDLMRYGDSEGLFADLAPYISKETTPNLHQLLEENKEYKNVLSDEDGHIWSLGYVNDAYDRGQISRAFLNYDWLEQLNLNVPTTLDEFVNVLRQFKTLGSNIVPMGGCYSSNNPCLILLNALGYVTEDATGCSIALRDGEVVLPVADREAYGAFVEVMKTLYSEGLIDKNFYTTDATSARAIIAEGRTGYLSAAPFVFTADFTSWWGAQPLTSDYNSTPQWSIGGNAMKVGGFVVSAKSENIELAMEFADWFFDPTGVNYNMSTNGPAASQTDYIYDDVVTGFEIDSETSQPYWPDYDENTDTYTSKNDYLGKEVYLWGHQIFGVGSSNVNANKDAVQYGLSSDEIIDSYPDVSAAGVQGELRFDTADDGEMNFRAALEDTLVPYLVEGYPGKVYLDANVATETGNLMTIVKTYAEQETAKFVTGRRSLDELDKYFDEIEALGATKVLEVYRDYYESVK